MPNDAPITRTADELYAVEAAELLGVHRKTVEYYRTTGILHARRERDTATGAWVYDEAEVRALAERRADEAEAKALESRSRLVVAAASERPSVRGVA